MRNKAMLCLLLLIPCFASAQSQNDVRTFLDRAQTAQDSEDYYTAVENYQSALSLNPSYLDALIGLAESYFYLEEYDVALQNATRARTLSGNRNAVRVLEGRIRIGLGDIEAAQRIFEEVLASEPNNLEARFGLAELDLSAGRTQSALSRFRDALTISPQNRKALLSLVYLYESLGDTASAETYLQRALRSYPDSPLVQYFAGRHAFVLGRFAEAESYCRTSLSLRAAYGPAALLLARVLIAANRPLEAVPLLSSRTAAMENDPLFWSILGCAYERGGNDALAFSSYYRAILASPDDEVARIAAENIFLRSSAGEAQLVERLAAYHFERGRALQERNQYLQAYAEYRRGLTLSPFSTSGRLLFAGILKRLGHNARYLEELNALVAAGIGGVEIQDERETVDTRLLESVSRRWNHPQFDQPSAYTRLSLFYTTRLDPAAHPFQEETLSRFTEYLLQQSYRIALVGEAAPIATDAEAYRAARNNASDVYLILDIRESERSFFVSLRLCLSRTGTVLLRSSFYGTGNFKITNTLRRIVDFLAGALPVQGVLLARNFDQGLLDLGSRDGLRVGDRFLILRRNSLSRQTDRPGLSYAESEVVGEFQIQAVDELVSEGRILRRGFSDRINIGDSMIPAVAAQGNPVYETLPEHLELYRQILTIR